MAKKLKGAVFVIHGTQIDINNIVPDKKLFNILVGDIFGDIKLNPGDSFEFSHNDIKYDPYPNKRKVLVLIIEENNSIYLLKFSEKEIGNMNTNETRKILIKIP